MSTQRSGGRIVVLSCHSEWVFDFDRQRFLRLPLGERNRDAHRFGSEGWQSFHEVEFETDTPNFVVYLNSDRSHLLRSYRHVEPCPRCADENPNPTATIELPRVERDVPGPS